MPATWEPRLANRNDIAGLERLITRSAHELQSEFYTAEQIEAAMGPVFGVDSQLIDDGTCFLVEEDNVLLGCGGWSRRRSEFGGDAGRVEPDSELNPREDPARIRAFFVNPDYARRGIGTAILSVCEEGIRDARFERVEIVATLSGERLYQKFGYKTVERFAIWLGETVSGMDVVRMVKHLA